MGESAGLPITPHAANLCLVTMCTMHLLRAIPNAGKYLELSIEGLDYYPWQDGLFLGDPYRSTTAMSRSPMRPAGASRSIPTGWQRPAIAYRRGPEMPGLHAHIDPEGLQEFSVVFTDRSLNHMSARFQGVMRDVSAMLKEVYKGRCRGADPGGRHLWDGGRGAAVRQGARADRAQRLVLLSLDARFSRRAALRQRRRW